MKPRPQDRPAPARPEVAAGEGLLTYVAELYRKGAPMELAPLQLLAVSKNSAAEFARDTAEEQELDYDEIYVHTLQ